MNNLLNIKSPAQDQAKARKSDYGLANHGLSNLSNVYWNLPTESLYEEITFRGEARISHFGPIIANTGILWRIASWRPRFQWDWPIARGMQKYGQHL